MSDYAKIDSRDLDNWITGHYGEDQLRDEPEDEEEYDEPDYEDERESDEL